MSEALDAARAESNGDMLETAGGRDRGVRRAVRLRNGPARYVPSVASAGHLAERRLVALLGMREQQARGGERDGGERDSNPR